LISNVPHLFYYDDEQPADVLTADYVLARAGAIWLVTGQ